MRRRRKTAAFKTLRRPEAVDALGAERAQHLAQLNIAMPRYAIDDPRMDGFVKALDAVNAIAERSDGFVWRLKGSGNDATDLAFPGEEAVIANMSVWRDVDALQRFVWTTVHRRFFDRKAEWFVPREAPDFVMWWVPAGTEPTLQEASDRLAMLRHKGPSRDAFGWADVTPRRYLGRIVDDTPA